MATSAWARMFHKTAPPPRPEVLPLGTVLHFAHDNGARVASRWALVVGEPDLTFYPVIAVGFDSKTVVATTIDRRGQWWHTEGTCGAHHTVTDWGSTTIG